MAAALRRHNASLIEDFVARPSAYDFFQSVRILEAWARECDTDREGRSSRGPADGAGDPLGVRLASAPQLSFPPGSLDRVQMPGADDEGESPVPTLNVSSLGLIGPSGVLPQHYTEDVLKRLSLRDETLRDFIDIFQQRALSLFYRAWQKYRLTHDWERAQADGTRGDIQNALSALVGIGTPGLRDRRSFTDKAYVYYFGHFAPQPRSAVGLQCVMSDYLQTDASVEPFVGRWLDLSVSQRTRLPLTSEGPEGQHNRLGQGASLGNRAWDLSSQVRLKLGPLKFERFRELLPGTDSHQRAAELAAAYLGPGIDCELELELEPDAIPGAQLGVDGEARPMLGRTAFLGADPRGGMSVPIAFTTYLSRSIQ